MLPLRLSSDNLAVYTLRVEHTLKDQSAITITHFREAPPTSPSSNKPSGGTASGTPPPQKPPASETYALILGYKDADIASLKKCLRGSKESIFNPFTLIKAFLAIEQGYRFTEVNGKIVDFQRILQNYGRLPFGEDGPTGLQDGGEGSEEDPKKLIGLYPGNPHTKDSTDGLEYTDCRPQEVCWRLLTHHGTPTGH